MAVLQLLHRYVQDLIKEIFKKVLTLFILPQLHTKLLVLEGIDVGMIWSNMVEESGEPGENHRPWMDEHFCATCLDPDSNPGSRGVIQYAIQESLMITERQILVVLHTSFSHALQLFFMDL